MKFPNFFEKKNEIPKNYQEAFKALASELIFTEKFDLDITPENLIMISRKIQEDFIKLDEDLQNQRRDELHELINWKAMAVLIKEGAPEGPAKEDFQMVEKEHMEMPEDAFLERKTAYFGAMQTIDQFVNYYGWGFTPALAKDAGKLSIGRNCFGYTISLGALCRRRGIKIDMGISTDHPYVIAYLKEGPWLADGQTEPRKILGKFEDHGNYKIYRPAKEDKIDAEMIMVEDFDKGVIYEVLENMEALRQISIGGEAVLQPNSLEVGKEIAEKHKETLRKIDWKDLQAKLLPDVKKSFDDNKKEWLHEVERIADLRERHHAENIFHSLLKFAQQATSFAGKDFQEGQKAILLEAQNYKTEIADLIFRNKSLPENVPADTKNFFNSLAESIKGAPPEIAKIFYSILDRKFVDKPTGE